MSSRSARRSRTWWLVAVGAAWVLTLLPVATVLAADPPADVVLDGTVQVTFVDGADGATPLVDAAVTVEAGRPDVDPLPFQTLTGRTGPDGSVTIDGVARAADGALPVTLTISATLARANDCGGTETLDGGTSVPSGAALAVTLTGDASSSCAAFPIVGMVVDADDRPFSVADAAAVITYPGAEPATVAVDVAADGTFAIVLHAWAGEGSTSVHLTVVGVAREVAGAGDCLDTVTDVVDVTWTLAEPVPPDPTIVPADRVVLGSVCGGGGSPAAPASAAPAVTLPPTDVVAAAAGASAGPSDARAALVALAAVTLVTLLAAGRRPGRRVSRRGS